MKKFISILQQKWVVSSPKPISCLYCCESICKEGFLVDSYFSSVVYLLRLTSDEDGIKNDKKLCHLFGSNDLMDSQCSLKINVLCRISCG